VRAVSMAKQRVWEAAKLGFHTCVVPAVCQKDCAGVEGIKVLGVHNVQEAIDLLF